MTTTQGQSKGWRVYIKESEIIFNPSPTELWVTTDEHPDSINDSGFAVSMEVAKWVDLPAPYHNNATGFSFADGHAEIHKWLGPTGIPPVLYGPNGTGPTIPGGNPNVVCVAATKDVWEVNLDISPRRAGSFCRPGKSDPVEPGRD